MGHLGQARCAHEVLKLVLGARAVWTDKSKGCKDFELKCRIVGKGFQEAYVPTLRRDSPMAPPQMANMLITMATMLQMRLLVVDVTGAFLQGERIAREFYFQLPLNLG